MEVQWILCYLVLGAVVGLLAGLLGIGGGAVMVPVLATLFAAQGVAREHLMHLALGTSMAAIVMTAISSVRSHHRHGAILWPVMARMTPGILVGTFLMTRVVHHLPARGLGIFFACFMTYVAVQMILNIKPKPNRQLPGSLALAGVGAGIGGISALVAIGGGSLTVPFLTWCNVSIRHAIATSAAVGLPIAVTGALGYILNGWGTPDMPPWTAGYVSLPAMAFISTASMLTAPLGANLAHKLPVGTLRKIFAALLLGLSLKMLHTLFF